MCIDTWALSPIASPVGTAEGKPSFISLGKVSGSPSAAFSLVSYSILGEFLAKVKKPVWGYTERDGPQRHFE